MSHTYVFPNTYSLSSQIPIKAYTGGYTWNVTVGDVVSMVLAKDSSLNCIMLVDNAVNPRDYYATVFATTIPSNPAYCADGTYIGGLARAYFTGVEGFPNKPSTRWEFYRNGNTGEPDFTSTNNSLSQTYTKDGHTYRGYTSGGIQAIVILLDTDYTVYYNDEDVTPSADIVGTGGGATHIAKVTGLLSTLSSNLSDVLIVAGGGGGGRVSSETAYTGANAGGISGSGSNSADQSTGYGFGQGESYGGGSGLYGGYKAENANGGGAGSGYIGNALLSNKKMVGYNVPTSSAESTKTESVQVYSANAEANKPKAGNGAVRIMFSSDINTQNILTHENFISKLPSSEGAETNIDDIDSSQLQYLFTDTDILTGQVNAKRFSTNASDELVYDSTRYDYTTSKYYIYLGGYFKLYRFSFKIKRPYIYNTNVSHNCWINFLDVKKENNQAVITTEKVMFGLNADVSDGVINDYYSVTRDASNIAFGGLPGNYNYICFVALNGIVDIKDLVIEGIQVS